LSHIDNPTPWPHTRNVRDLNSYIGDNCFFGGTITKSLLTLNAGYSSIEYGLLTAPPRWAGNLVVFNMTREQREHPEHGGYVRELHNHVNLSGFRYAFDYLTRQNYIFESPKKNPYYIRKLRSGALPL
jgi:hypothetical protein